MYNKHMQPHVFIFMGRSGSGKGKQIELLQQYFTEEYPTMGVQSYNCGDQFREFFKSENTLSSLVKKSVTEGNYQPDFFATTLLFSTVFKTVNTTDHLLFDGYPRSLKQLSELKELLMYLGKTNALVIDISVTSEEVIRRMMLRGRTDDSQDGAQKRQEEFDRAVAPTLEAIENDPFFTYLKIDGMPLPGVVHQNILQAISQKIHG